MIGRLIAWLTRLRRRPTSAEVVRQPLDADDETELAAAQAAATILEILGPLSPRDDDSVEKLRTAARIAAEQTKTLSSDEEINLLRSKVTIHISALVYAWQQKEPLPKGVINRARTAIQAWMEALIVRG
jgi:hypothetical protein